MNIFKKSALVLCAASAMMLTACPGGGNEPVAVSGEMPRYSLEHAPWYDAENAAPPGADPSVSAEDGGDGFEAIAEDTGWDTFVATDEETRLFGSPNAKKGGEFVNIITRFPLSFRPFYYGKDSYFAENNIMSGMVYESLLTLHPSTLRFMPALASHWKISDDKRTFWFRINPNARFSDGSPVTSRDVVATYRLIMDESLLSPSLRVSYEKYSEPVPESKYIVRVDCTEDNWRAFMGFAASTQILSANEIGDLTGTEFLEMYHLKMPLGTGPYVVDPDDIKNQKEYIITRREDFWARDWDYHKVTGNFDRIVIKVVKDNQTLEYEKFKKGEQDYFYFTSSTMEQWVHDTYPSLENGLIQKYRVETQAAAGRWGIVMNMRKPPFDDIRIRKAFAHLFDREKYAEEALYGEYGLLDSYYQNSPYANDDNPIVRFDPEKASELLAEAGWTERNESGILTKDGQQFSVDLGIVKPVEKFVTPYQQTLREAGIDLKIKFQDGNALSEASMNRNFVLSWELWGSLIFPNPETSLLGKLADEDNNTNTAGFKNDRVDELIEVYNKEFDITKRYAIAQEIDSIVMETYKEVHLWYAKGVKLGVWKKFGMPEWVFQRYTRSGDHTAAIYSYWWYEPEMAAKTIEAMQTGAVIEPYDGTPKSVKYWEGFTISEEPADDMKSDEKAEGAE